MKNKQQHGFHTLSLFAVLSVWLLTVPAVGAESDKIYIQPGCEFVFADIETGQKILTERDMFTQALSSYTKASTLKTTEPVTTAQYLDFLKKQVREWNELEKEMVRWAVREASGKLSPYHLKLPEKIYLIKTTGKDMDEAAYCRDCAIVFPEPMIFPLGPRFEYLVIHELFHVYSRYNLEHRGDLYAVLGFKPCNEIELPRSVRNRELTNPDAPLNNYYLEISHEDNPALPVLPVVLNRDTVYDPNQTPVRISARVVPKLMVIEKKYGRWTPALKEGNPILLEMRECESYFEHVGLNTTYIWGPEEILAENFTLLILDRKDPPSPEILEKLKTFLMKHQASNDEDVPATQQEMF